MSTKNRPRGRPQVDSELVRSRIGRETLVAFDRWRERHDPPLNRAEGIRFVVKDWLEQHGEMPVADDPPEGEH